MHALAIAHQRLIARIRHPRTPVPVRLAQRLVQRGESHSLPVLSSRLARQILSGGYDARTLNSIYSQLPAPGSGPIGQFADRMILDIPFHRGLKEQFEATVGEVCAAAVLLHRGGAEDIRILFSPCGVGAEIAAVAEKLSRKRPATLSRVRFWGVDPDRDGTLLPDARRAAREAGARAEFLRADLRRHRDVAAVASEEGPFHVISAVGLTQLYTGEALAAELRFLRGMLAQGGTLILDRREPAEAPRVARSLQYGSRNVSGRQLGGALTSAGLAATREHPSGDGGCVLVVVSPIEEAPARRAPLLHLAA